jgi:mannitol-1-phosphate/altronate dehydrogenase
LPIHACTSSLTVTEKGYRLAADGSLVTHLDVQCDLPARPPASVLGYPWPPAQPSVLAAPAMISCDNVANNGDCTARRACADGTSRSAADRRRSAAQHDGRQHLSGHD